MFHHVFSRQYRSRWRSKPRGNRYPQDDGGASEQIPSDGGADYLPDLHRQPHQASVSVRSRLLHWLQHVSRLLPHLQTGHSRSNTDIRLIDIAGVTGGSGLAGDPQGHSLPLCEAWEGLTLFKAISGKRGPTLLEKKCGWCVFQILKTNIYQSPHWKG